MTVVPGKTKIMVVGPSLKMGGMERAVSNITNGIHEAGYNVVFVALFDHVIFFKLHKEIEFLAPTGYNIRKMNFWKTILRLRTLVEEKRPEIILVYNKFYAALTLFSLFFFRRKPAVFVSERSSPLYRWSLPIRIFNRVVFSLGPPDGVIAQTEVAARYQRGYYSRSSPVRVIPNILRTVERYPGISREHWILAVGRLNDPLKGFDRLLKSYARLKEPRWKLLVAGGKKGEDQAFDALVQALGIEGSVELLGKVSDVDRLYAQASIFVIPSRSEGYPNALCEAMSAGMACISFDFVAGPQEIITSGVNGLLVPDGDIDGLAAAITRLVCDESLRMALGKEAGKIKEYLQASVIVQKHIDFFNESGKGK